jgi:outer membrane protein TolC
MSVEMSARGACLLLLILMGTGCPAREAAAEADAVKGPTLEAMVAEAVERDAELTALGERVRAAEAMVAPMGALPDPMALVALSNVPMWGLELDRTPMSGVEAGVSQQVPGSGKRRLRREVQSQAAEILRARYRDRRNDVARRVRRTYFDIQYLDEALEIGEQSKGLAEDFLATAEARYATGKGLQQDVFRAQVRLSRMVDLMVALRETRSAAATRLNKLLYRPASSVVPRLPRLEERKLSQGLDGEALAARAEAENPRLEELRIGATQAATKEALAAQGLRPDFTLGLKYRLRESVPMDPVRGEDFWSLSAGMSLPWLYRRDKVDQEVEAAGAERRAREAEVEALRNELSARVEELVIELRRLGVQIALLETGLLPQAEGALSSSYSAYRTGQVELLTLMDNQMNLYNLQLQRIALMAERERDLAELDYVVGARGAVEMEVKSGAD